MARIRTIKPEFWDHPKVVRVSRDARLLFIGLLSEADDYGKLRYGAKRLAGLLFSADDDVAPAEVDAWAAELELVRLVRRYEVDGASLLMVLGFTEHQKVSHPSNSRLPDPPERIEPIESAAVVTLPTSSGVAQESLVPDLGTGNREREQGMEVARRGRAPDLLWEAVIECWQIDPSELTKIERDRVNAAVGQLRAIDAQPDHVPIRRANYRRRHPDAADTPMAVVGRWAECATPPDVRGNKTLGALARVALDG